MEQYISKATLVAEIENLIDKNKYHDVYENTFRDGNNSALYALKGRIDTIEVKEVDLEKEVDIEDAVHGTVDYPLIGCDFPNIYPNYKELKEYCDRKGIKDNDKVKLIIIKDT